MIYKSYKITWSKDTWVFSADDFMALESNRKVKNAFAEVRSPLRETRLKIEFKPSKKKLKESSEAERKAFIAKLATKEEAAKKRAKAHAAKQKAEEAKWAAKRKAEAKKREDELKKFLKDNPLPNGIKFADLRQVDWKERPESDYNDPLHKILSYSGCFEIWLTPRFGWVIPTLHIANARGTQQTRRSYGVSVDGQMVRVGQGPHVKKTLKVYVSKKNLERLQPFLDLYLQGMEHAHTKRDQISTRRANSRNRTSIWGF